MAGVKDLWSRRPSAALFLVVSYLLWAAVGVRWIMEFIEQDLPQLWLISTILAVYGLLLGLEPLITGDANQRAHVYLALQTALVFVASLLHYELDFFAILYLPLCGQAMLLLPRRQALAWVGVLIAATIIGEIFQFGWPQALSFIFLYVAGLVFIAAFSNITLQAEASRQRSETLLAQLQVANERLQEFAGQAEKLAVANERNRLARDLHDSVAQTLYGLTLQAETASRKLSAGQLEAAQAELRQIGQSAQQTLQETRLLVFELRPPLLEQEGLTAALAARLGAVEARSGMEVHSDYGEVGRLPPDDEVGLYRIAQEALNNVLKHSQASEVTVSLRRDDLFVHMSIADDGIGFERERISWDSGLGLQGMKERAEQIGATLSVESARGEGTVINVELPL